MGFHATWLVAQWGRPLVELAVNELLLPEEMRDPDDSLSWSRSDGWQCYVPSDAAWGHEDLPPVQEIAAETGGPVLGMWVDSSDHYRLSFIEGGGLRTIAYGPTEHYSERAVYEEMVELWGDPWPNQAAASLRRWAAPFADASLVALRGALAVPQLYAQRTVMDLLKLLALIPDEQVDGPEDEFLSYHRDVWWSRVIPDAVYAIDATDVRHRDLDVPMVAFGQRDLVLAFTEDVVGVWSCQQSRWDMPPSTDLRLAKDQLGAALRRRGWPERS